ncbi:hypothetical protein [Sulfitobacter aestuariivivens]|uniref:hypothetical protein n=1 Tax=Sulfitobacter aestuariivivens TaxID=2766981 RepID=UPI0036096931
MKYTILPLSLISLGLATPALSDIVQNDDVIIRSELCVGNSDCVDGEQFGSEEIRVKGTTPEILLFDTSPDAANQWKITGDNGVGNGFSIGNAAQFSTPFPLINSLPPTRSSSRGTVISGSAPACPARNCT